MTAAQYIALKYEADYLSLCSQAVPADSGSLLLSQSLSPALQVSVGYYLRSKLRVTDASSDDPTRSYFPTESPMRRMDIRIASSFGKKERPGGGEIAVVLQNAFQDNYTGYGNVRQRTNLLFKRRAYFTATINF
jgi:hypothetical protein